MRRIDRVIFRVSNDGCTACIDAVFHRTPVRREVTVGAALGLMELRVPATVERR